MAVYVIEKKNNVIMLTRKKRINFNGYVIHPKWKEKKEIVKVNTITITSDLLKNNYLLMKFSISYRKLFKSVLERLDSDSSSSDTMLSLDELVRMKQVLKDKYMQVVSKEEYKKMLVKMELLEHKLKERIMIEKSVQKYIERQLMEEEVKEKGRGR